MAAGPRLTSSGALYLPGTTGIFDEVTYSPSNLADSKNLFTNSQDFSSQGYWIATGSSYLPVATDVVAPDGTLTASVFTGLGQYPNVTKYYTGFQGIVAQPGEVYTFSVYLKYVNQPVACLVQEDGWSGFYTIVNIQTGTITGNGFAITSSSVTDAGNGWYRCSATFTIPSLQTSWTNGSQYYYTNNPIPVIKFNPQIRLGNYDGTNYAGKQMLVWGAQVELGSTATSYQPTGIPANYFRFSQNFTQQGSGGAGSWYYDNISASNNVTLAPDGTMTGGVIVSTITGGNNTAFIQQYPTLPVNNTNFTYSIYLKQGTSPTTLVDLYNASPYNEITATVTWGPTPTMTTGTGSGGVIVASSFTAAPNGWYRVSLTINTLNNTGALICRVYVRGQGANNVTGEYVYIWGAQLEQGSAPTAYVANGINITKIRQLTQVFNNNLLTYSQSFSTAPWTLALSTIGATITAPDGTSTGQKLVCSSDATTQFHYVAQSFTITAGGTYTFSVFVKAAELTNVGVYQNSGNNGTKWDLSTQTVIANDTGVTSTINASTNGWYRITNTYTYASAGTYSVRIYLMGPGTSFIGNGVSGLYIWGAQLEYNNCISPYQVNLGTITTVVPVTQTASKSTTDGSVLIPGTFDEITYNTLTPTIVNLLSYTEQFDNAAWSTIGTMTVTANSAIAPNNTLTADTLILGNGLALNSSARGQQYTKPAVSAPYTFSVYAKPAGFDSVRIYFRDNNNNVNNVYAVVNVSTGAVTTAPIVSGTFTNPSGTVTSVGNGWYRISVTATTGADTTIRAQVYTYDSVASVGNGVSGVYFWGFQFESNSTPSIYQPIAAANTLVTTGVAQKVTSSGNTYVSGNFDEWVGVPVANGLVLYVDGAISSSYTPGSTTWYNIANTSANGSITTTSAGVATSNEIDYDPATMSLMVNDNRNFITGQIRFPNINYDALAASGNFTVMFAAKKDYYGLSGNLNGNSELFQAVNNGYGTGWRITEDNQGTPGAPFTGTGSWGLSMSPAAIPAGWTWYANDSASNRWNIVAFSVSPTTVYGFCNNNITTRSNPGTYYGGAVPDNRGWVNFTGAGAGSFNGKLGFFMVYNRALTTAEMSYNYTQFARRYGLS